MINYPEKKCLHSGVAHTIEKYLNIFCVRKQFRPKGVSFTRPNYEVRARRTKIKGTAVGFRIKVSLVPYFQAHARLTIVPILGQKMRKCCMPRKNAENLKREIRKTSGGKSDVGDGAGGNNGCTLPHSVQASLRSWVLWSRLEGHTGCTRGQHFFRK